MRITDILRQLADLVDSAEKQPSNIQQAIQSVEPSQVPHRNQAPSLVAIEVPNNDNAEAGVFVPPLQAKLELLKKSVNVDNIYDQGGEDGDLTGHGADNEDELARMKQRAGIKPAAQQEAADDEPLDQ